MDENEIAAIRAELGDEWDEMDDDYKAWFLQVLSTHPEPKVEPISLETAIAILPLLFPELAPDIAARLVVRPPQDAHE
jgi:hypothetical protein